MMKIIFYLLIFSLSVPMFGQEKPINFINWETKEIPISLSENKQTANSFNLPKIDFNVDIRKEGLRKNKTSIIEIPENQYITQKHNVSIPKVRFTINREDYIGLSNTGDIKNIAYKDASLYSGYFCPVTGVALSQ